MKDFIKNKNVYFVWTVIYLVVLLFVLRHFINNNVSLIWKNDAGLDFRSIVWYARYIRECATNVFSGNFKLRMWDHYIGEGSDIFLFFNQYCLGDPFTVLSALVPDEYIYIYYQFMNIFRLYAAGIVYILMCKKFDIIDNYALISGALTYVFSGFAMLNLTLHHFFLIPFPLMPLVVIGIEKVINKESPIIYILVIFVSCISNVFFFYQIVILTFIYTLVRLCVIYQSCYKMIVINILKVGLLSIIALLMASAILIPALRVMLNDGRTHVDYGLLLFYPFSYYRDLIRNLMVSNTGYWMQLGFPGIAVLSFVVLFVKHNNRNLKKLFYIIVIMIVFPLFGKIFNGGGYITNRCSWCISLLVAFNLSYYYRDLTLPNRKLNLSFLKLTISFLILLCLLGITLQSIMQLAFVLIFISFNIYFYGYKSTDKILLSLLAISIIFNSEFRFSNEYGRHINQCINQSQVNNSLLKSEADVILSIDDDRNYRYALPRYNQHNGGMISRLSSTNFANSFTPKYNKLFKQKFGMMDGRNTIAFWGYDFKTNLLALSSVKYISRNNSDVIPYGYSLYNLKGNKNIYINNYYLPMAYTYDNVIDYKKVANKNSVELQDIILKYAIVNNDNEGFNNNKNVNYDDEDLVVMKYDIKKATNDVDINQNSIVTYKKNQKIRIDFDGVDNSEVHLLWFNMDYRPYSEYDLYYKKVIKFDDKEINIDRNNKYLLNNLSLFKSFNLLKEKIIRGIEPTSVMISYLGSNNKHINKYYSNKYYSFYGGEHDFDINFGYEKKAMNSIVVTFSEIGVYTFDSLNIYSLVMDNYKKYIQKLNSKGITNILLSDDKFSLVTNFNADKFLCVAIPYYDGWEAYVDGEKKDLYVTNIYHMGLNVSKGKHKIELLYKNKYIIIGRWISLLGIVLFVFVVIIQAFKDKHSNKI